jgi:nicotine blue oxidoreductase
LRCGLEALDVQVEVAVVVLADGPDLSPHAIERVLAVARRERRIVAASYDGQRGHPLVLPRELWGDVPDEGLQGWPVRLVPCDDLGAPGDVDEPADLPLRLRG